MPPFADDETSASTAALTPGTSRGPGASRPPGTFGGRVREAVRALGPLCVGIDPSPGMLDLFGLPDDAGGLLSFGEACVDALYGVAAVVKPQVAFFERHGASGISAFEQVVAVARDAGMLVIADAKRGDIGSTTEAYADAWFRGPLAADAVTATPYVGIGALAPMVIAARETGRGLIVVVTSSNPEGRGLQEAVLRDGTTVEAAMVRAVGSWNAEEIGGSEQGGRLGSVGVVVGATGGSPPAHLSDLAGVVLAPGLGAQGGTVADVARRFGDCPPASVLPSASRALLSLGRGGLRSAASRLRDDLVAALP
ncbi:MAG TPA: orotidine-5'-phosphate decarboxylase [Acidimicrobiales bacterium]|nr:orotidine-5'-phosphate decarboxylase [Acidimicrobiales bacterium]